MDNINTANSVRKPYQSTKGPWFIVEYTTNGKTTTKLFWDVVKAYDFYRRLSR